MSDIFSRMQHKYVKTIFKTWDVREICDIGQLIRLDSEGNSENFLSWQMTIEKLEFELRIGLLWGLRVPSNENSDLLSKSLD